MSLHATSRLDEGVATITLVGTLDPGSVPELAELVEETEHRGVRQLVLNARRLTSVSFAAVRYLATLHQRLGRGVRISVHDASAEVAETVKLAGLDQSVLMTER